MKQQFNAKQSGAGLVEIMISAFILGIGLLGILTLQGTSMQYNQQAYYQSQAAFFAQDIAERIRANRVSLSEYEIEYTYPSPALKDCAAENCAPEELASWDLNAWKADLAAALPEGDGEIQTAAGSDLTSISIRYLNSRGAPEEEIEDAEDYVTVTVSLRFY